MVTSVHRQKWELEMEVQRVLQFSKLFYQIVILIVMRFMLKSVRESWKFYRNFADSVFLSYSRVSLRS